MDVVGVVEDVDVVEGAVADGEGVLLGEGGTGGDAVVSDGVDLVVDEGGAIDPLSDPAASSDDPPSDKVRGRRVTPKEDMAERLEAAIKAFKEDLYPSVRQCAKAFRVHHVTLGNMLKDPDKKYVGKGKVSQVFRTWEEDMIVRHIKERMLVGCGMDVMQVRMIQ